MTGKIVRLPGFPDDTEKFLCEPNQWGCARRAAMLAGCVMTVVLGFSGVLISISVLQHIAASGIDPYVREHFSVCLMTIVIPLMLFVGVTGIVLGYADIAIGEDDVWLHLIASWYLLVPKQSFEKMEISEVLYTGMQRHLKPHGRSFAIHVPGLTPFHRLVGLMHGLWFTPVFLVTPDHEGYETLLNKLKLMRVVRA